jgi:mono/diheme cytochrome c family protein
MLLATGVAAADKPSFRIDIQPLLNENCVACHQTGSAQQGLALEPGKAYGNLVGAKSRESKLMLVSPGQPNASYLLNKLDGTHLKAGGMGQQMPLGDPLTAAQIAQIRAWITQGAPRN